MIAVSSLKTRDGGKSRQQKAGCPAQAGDRLKEQSLSLASKSHRNYVDSFTLKVEEYE